MRLLLAAVLVLGLGTSTLFADDKSSGCGLGWAVTKRMSLVSSLTRYSTNTIASNTIGMTSGTSGCSKHPIAKKDTPAFIYAFNNYEVLSIEMAEGRGEYLHAFARTLGCSDSAINDFGRFTQKHYESIMGTNNAMDDMFYNLRQQMKKDATLAMNCQAA